MKPFPYCPEALIKIRNGATAHMLGWDQTFYASVCRKHGIEGALPTSVAPAVVAPAPVDVVPPPVKKRKAAAGAQTNECITVSLPLAHHRRIKAICDAGGGKRGTSVSAQVRGFIDRALAANTLPIWRGDPNDNLRVYATVTCPIATVDMIDAQSKALGIHRAEFIRRAIAAGLSETK